MAQDKTFDSQIIDELQKATAEQLPLLKAPADTWQPSGLLPDFAQENWAEEVRLFKVSPPEFLMMPWPVLSATPLPKRPCLPIKPG